MFYCDPCAVEQDWPSSLAISYGRCEICSKVAACNDVPSYLLPARNEEDE